MQTLGATAEPAVGKRVPHAIFLAAAVAVAHGVNDLYAAFLSPLLPRIMGRMGLSVALAATLAMTLSLAASILQPLMGHFADRYGRRLFVVAGPLLSAIFLSLIGVAPTFWVLVIFLVLGGLGSAAFHPPGASMAARVAEGGGSGVRLSLFSFGGSAGYALGPLVAVAIVARRGLPGMWVAMVPGVLLALVLAAVFPRDSGTSTAPALPTPRRVASLLAGPLGLVFGISALAAFVQRVFLTMQPIAVAAAGGAEALGALSLTAYLAGQAAGSLAGGILTDRVERGRLLASLAILSVPTHLLALGLPAGTPLALGAAAVAGLVNMAMLPPVVILAQEITPGGTGLSSGIVMGLAWATGSVGVLGTGVLGDVVGARSAALLSVPLLLIAAVLAVHPALAPHRASRA